jgi:putative ABC transport system substrate-binding protein
MTSPLAARAQTGRIRRLCLVTFDPVTAGYGRYAPFLERLRELGYVEGRTIAIDWLSAEGQADRFPAIAADCVRRNADVIVVGTTPAAAAAKGATGTIPIVMLPLGDPVGTGLVSNLARPDANLTGTTNLAPLMVSKGLELLKEAIPVLARVLVLTYPSDPISPGQIAALRQSAATLGIELVVHGVAGPGDFAAGFEAGRKAQVQAVIATVESIFFVNRVQLIALTRASGLPSLFTEDSFVKIGGLLSYDADRPLLTNRSADFVDKVLRGAAPRDLPIEQPSVFTIAVNLATARALGITIPPSILARADEIIE